MTRLILKMSISLDGYIGSIDPTSRWNLAGGSPDSTDWLVDVLRGARAHLMGATTYRVMAGFWPVTSGPVAAAMNELPKVVFSQTLESTDWTPTTIVSGDLAEGVSRLKEEQGEDYLLAEGGARFARSLVQAGLVDEFRLAVHPVILGDGERLFTGPLTLTPVDTMVFQGGIVVHTFTAARPVPDAEV